MPCNLLDIRVMSYQILVDLQTLLHFLYRAQHLFRIRRSIHLVQNRNIPLTIHQIDVLYLRLVHKDFHLNLIRLGELHIHIYMLVFRIQSTHSFFYAFYRIFLQDHEVVDFE